MKPLTLVVASDDHYIVMLAALIKSIEAHLKVTQTINIYIIENQVSNSKKKKLEKSVNKQITNLLWIKSADIIPAGTKLPVDKSSFPLTIYLRLFIPHFIPEEIEKVLYLDIDMIVRRDIAELFNTDLNGKIVAAVLDPKVRTFDNSWGGVKNYKELGCAADTHYFNSGLLLMDTKKWRDEDVANKTIECVERNKEFANYPDQYGLNIVLANKWHELDSRWNHFATLPESDPFLIHFVQRKPIYKSYNYNEDYKRQFYYYLSLTAWKSFKPIGESRRYLKKVMNVVEKFFK